MGWWFQRSTPVPGDGLMFRGTITKVVGEQEVVGRVERVEGAERASSMAGRQRRCGATVIVSLLVASPVLLVSLPAGAAAAPAAKVACPAAVGVPDRQFLFFNVCGPRDVTRNTNYNYTIVLTNGGHTGTGKVKLSMFHYDPITRSSVPYRQASGRVQFQWYEANWTLASFRATVTLSIRQHGKSSLFIMRAVGQHPGAVGGMKKDVFFR